MGLIQLTNVNKGYHMGEIDIPVLTELDMDVEAGELVGFFGPSGSGKTTLLNIIAGIDHPTSGEVVVAGNDLHDMDAKELSRYRREVVGYIFQFYNLLPTLTAEENVALPLELLGRKDRKKVATILGKVGLGDKLDRFPAQLSGGEQQRVAIARALVKEPRVLIGDEPTGNLDAKTSRDIIKLLRELNADLGITVLIATHDPNYRQVVSRAVSMEGGKVVTEETSGEQR